MSYVRTQATVAGAVNFVVNPAIDWIAMRHKGPQPVWGASGLVVNFAVTSLILSTLVGIFVAMGARRERRAGRLEHHPGVAPRWLPQPGWLAGLTVGAAAAVLVVAVSWLLHQAGVTTLKLPGLMLVKAVYSGVLGFTVARWVILRQQG